MENQIWALWRSTELERMRAIQLPNVQKIAILDNLAHRQNPCANGPYSTASLNECVHLEADVPFLPSAYVGCRHGSGVINK